MEYLALEPNTILYALVVMAGFYMAWNIGANDVANAMGTSVGSGALTLGKAVVIAAVLEFSGAYFFGSHVSETIQKGIVDPEVFKMSPDNMVYGMLASLIAAGAWLQIASYFGWPVSTTHTIVGAVIGFGVIVGGAAAVKWSSVGMIVSSWAISPLFGGIIGFLLFSFLRKKILYSITPLHEAKKLAPLMVAIVAFTLFTTLLAGGLKNIEVHLSKTQEIITGLVFALFAAFICFIFIKKKTFDFYSKKQNSRPYNPEVAREIEKAEKQLKKAISSSDKETSFKLTQALENLQELGLQVKSQRDQEMADSEYAAVEKIFSYLQIMSACLMAFAHGANDVSNAIGPMAAAINVLSTGKVLDLAPIPSWTLALGGVGIVIGLATWGWRVIETVGKNITELTPTRGFSAEFATSSTVLAASALGLPISTTHTLVGAVLGVGMARGLEALNLGMAREIFISWVVTVPAGALLTVTLYYLLHLIFT